MPLSSRGAARVTRQGRAHCLLVTRVRAAGRRILRAEGGVRHPEECRRAGEQPSLGEDVQDVAGEAMLPPMGCADCLQSSNAIAGANRPVTGTGNGAASLITVALSLPLPLYALSVGARLRLRP